jgi:hypothetical protein
MGLSIPAEEPGWIVGVFRNLLVFSMEVQNNQWAWDEGAAGVFVSSCV